MERNQIPFIETAHLERAAEVLKTVAHPIRLQIVDILERGEKSVSDLCHLLGTPQPYTSQQLNMMKAKGILSSRRDGNQVYYAVANPSVIHVIHCVRMHAGGGQRGDAAQEELGVEEMPAGMIVGE